MNFTHFSLTRKVLYAISKHRLFILTIQLLVKYYSLLMSYFFIHHFLLKKISMNKNSHAKHIFPRIIAITVLNRCIIYMCICYRCINLYKETINNQRGTQLLKFHLSCIIYPKCKSSLFYLEKCFKYELNID